MRGYEDPPEYRERTQLALPPMTPAVKWILWIDFALFVLFLDQVFRRWSLGRDLYETLALAPESWRAWWPFAPVWQLVTYGFLHSADPFHILFNMLSLYFFGTLVESLIGTRRFLWTYLASIAFGGALQLAAGLLTEQGGSAPITIGASGGIMCLIVAAAVLRPQMLVIFILFPLKLRTLALIMVGLDVLGLLQGSFGTAHLVHLGGAAYGFLAARLGWMWFEPRSAWAARRSRRSRANEQGDRERLDRLLQQIHEQGIHSLSRGDRRFLKRVSGRS